MPFSFLKKLKPTESIGLDWGIRDCKWIQIKEVAPNRYRLLHLHTLSLPEDPRERTQRVKEYVMQAKWNGFPTAISLPNLWVQMRRMDLPKMPTEDLKEAIRWQMRDIAEGSIDDYTIQYTLVGEETKGDVSRLTVIGFALSTKKMEEEIRGFEQCGLKPFFMEPAAVSLAATISRLYPNWEREWIGCVDFQPDQTTFLMLGEKKLQFVRPLAGLMATGSGNVDPEFAAKCAMEIQRGMDAFAIGHPLDKIDLLFLAGEGANYPELTTSLKQNLGIQTEVLNPFSGIEQVEAFPLAKEKPHLFGAATGLGWLKP